MSSVTIPPPDSHLRCRAASTPCFADERPTYGLTCAEAELRFGIGRVVLANLCRQYPGLGIKEAARQGHYGWHWIIDPPRLGDVLGERLDPEAFARWFDVPVACFATLDPRQRAVLAAILPLPERRRRPPRPPRAVRGVGHETP